VIVAVPPNLAGRIVYQPGLPPNRDLLTQQMPQGMTTKCQAVYDTPFWREDGFSGEAVSERGPVGVIFDNSPKDSDGGSGPGVLVGFMTGTPAREVAGLPPDRRQEVVLECFARLGLINRYPLLMGYIDWLVNQQEKDGRWNLPTKGLGRDERASRLLRLAPDWKSPNRRSADLTFRVVLILKLQWERQIRMLDRGEEAYPF